MKPFRERDWQHLISQIAGGMVVPVLGAETVTISPGDGSAPLPLEEFLRHGLSLEFTEAASPDATTLGRLCGNLRRLPSRRPQECYLEAYHLLHTASPAPSPPLTQLAEILPFRVFVTTTPDDYLSRALRESRGTAPVELVYSPNRRTPDLPEHEPVNGTVVYKIFGTASPGGDFALADEDILLFMNRLQDPEYQPRHLMDLLRRSTLLILGSNFPDWLARFFLFAAQGEPFLQGSSRVIVADRNTVHDDALTAFLERGGAQVWPDGDADAFVAELHSRWMASHAPTPHSSVDRPSNPMASAFTAPKDALFISYASEDTAPANALAEAFQARGLPVWLDKQRLETGNEFRDLIRRNIDTASFFLPLLSRHTVTTEPRFFKREWTWALDQREARLGVDYVLPITIDAAVRPDEPLIPEAFRRLHWQRCLDGAPPDEFLDAVLRKFRALRSGRARNEPIA